MEKEDVKLGDFYRMFIGEAPVEFLVEVFIRTLFIYVAFFFLVRWLGKRMNGQLTVTEMVVMLTLGGIISVPMQTPDRGLIQGLIVLLCAFVFQRGTTWLGFKRGAIEKWTQGDMNILVKDGEMLVEEMKRVRISQRQLFIKLREENIHNLGEVKRVYIEACGIFSIYKNKEKKPGLTTLPLHDPDALKSQKVQADKIVCMNCGHLAAKSNTASCEICKENNWTHAVL